MSVGLSALSEAAVAAPETAKLTTKAPPKRQVVPKKDDRLAAEAR